MKLYTLYDMTHTHIVHEGILAILINSQDVTSLYSDIRASLALPHNITAEALVLLHKYQSEDHVLPYYVNFHDFAIDLIQKTMDEDASTTSENTRVQWEGQSHIVTLIDYELNERAYISDAYLCG